MPLRPNLIFHPCGIPTRLPMAGLYTNDQGQRQKGSVLICRWSMRGLGLGTEFLRHDEHSDIPHGAFF